MANIVIAYLAWVLGGLFGLHHFYLGRDKHAFVWWISMGGFGLGWFRDLWRLPEYLYSSNEDSRSIAEFADRRRRHPKPKFSTVRFAGAMLIGNLLSYLFRLTIPEIVLNELNVLGPILKVILPILGSALGVYLVYTIGNQKSAFRWCLIGACVATPWLLMETQSLVMGPVVASIVAHLKAQWDPDKKRRKGICNFFKRVFILSVAGSLYFSMWTSVIYFNVHITSKDREQVPIYVAVNNFFRSPVWKEMKKTLSDLYEFCQTNGWGNCYDQFIERLDPTGETSAYSTLELEPGATPEEIQATCRKLSRKWHPDKFKTETEKAQAQEMFIEIRNACDILSSLQQRRAEKNMKSDTTTSKPKYDKKPKHDKKTKYDKKRTDL